MKKTITLLFAVIAAFAANAYDVTNTVTIVSNIYNRIATTYYVTNNVKNTHVNYYYTNNVYFATNKTILVSQENHTTNISHTVTYDASQEAVSAAQGYASSAAGSASSSAGSASAAAGSAGDAYSYLQQIILRQSWFDEHFGQMVTNINHNYYTAVDSYAREIAEIARSHADDAQGSANAAQASANAAQASANAAQASANAANQGVANSIEYTTAVSNKLEQGVANSIEYTTAVSNKLEQGVAVANQAAANAQGSANAAQASANAANQGVANSIEYTTAVSNKLELGVANSIEYTTAVSNKLEQGVANSIEYTTAVSNKLEQGVADLDSKFDMIQDRMLIYNNEHEIWNYEVYDGDTLVMTIRIPMWDRWKEGSFYYYAATYWRKVSGYSLTIVYKGESTGMMYFGLKHSESTKNVRMIWTDESLDKGVKGDSEIWYDYGSRIFVRYVSDHKEFVGFVKSDLNIYDANSNVVDRIATTNDYGDAVHKTEDIEYFPGGDWNYDIIDAFGNVVSTFTVEVDLGIINPASDPGYTHYKTVDVHGFYVDVRFKDDVYEVGLIGTSSADRTVKVWVPFYQRSSDWHMPPRGETAAAHTSEYIGWKVRYNSSPKVDRSYYTKFDPAKYDANTNKIGRTAFMDDLNALSNWVERTFQKQQQ